VLKESGTSATSSGAQSLKILSEMRPEAVQAALDECLNNPRRPYILQEIVASPRISFTALNPNDDKLIIQHGAGIKLSVFYVAGRMTDIKFIASNRELAVNNRDCVEGVVRY
jgi:hypothetical protein